MRSHSIKRARRHTKGFTLIATLLMLVLLSGIAVGLMMMVNTEGKVGGTDLQNNLAYHAAEGGIEQMYANLSAVMQNVQVPTAAQICGVGLPTTNGPSMVGVIWKQYSVMPGNGNGSTCPSTLDGIATWGTITAGPNSGLYAQVIPLNMTVTASMLGGQEVTMMRNAQIALIPVFQFGMFCDGDCSIYPGGNMTFAGPMHGNGDFYPFAGSGASLTFQGKVATFGNIVRTQLPNTQAGTSDGTVTGTVYVPTSTTTPCSTQTTNCVALAAVGTKYGDGSVTGGGSSTAQPAANISSYWSAFSQPTTNYQFINGNYYVTGASTPAGTGAKKLSLPFVNGTNFPYEIIRRPPSGESPTSALGASREYNMAQIHVLLDDDPCNLPYVSGGTYYTSGGCTDSNNIRLANITTTQATATGATATNPYGITMTAGNYPSSYAAGTYQLYFAAATNALPSAGTVFASSTASANGADTADWPYAPAAWYGNANNAYPTQQGLQPPGPTGGTSVCSTAGKACAPVLSGSSASVAPALAICPPASPTPQNGVPTGCPASGTAPPSPYYAVGGAVNGAMPANSAAGEATAVAAGTATWNLIDGYLRVEYLNNSGVWVAVTQEWLNLGFARGVTAPSSPGNNYPAAGTNPINPNAILLLQEPAERQTPSAFQASASQASLALPSSSSTLAQIGAGTAPVCITQSGTPAKCTEWAAVPPLLTDSGWAVGSPAPQWQFGTSSNPASQSVTQFNWYPINFYDPREGETRDIDWSSSTRYNTNSDNTCTTNGVMNAIEIDVGNLNRWLLGQIGTSGTSVNSSAQNGYVLYFSDRRGMLVNPNATSSHPASTKSGDSGLEDTVNSTSNPGVPDGHLETTMTGQTYSPEDDNENGVLDNWGANNLGLGFYGTGTPTSSPNNQNLNALIMAGAAPNPYGTVASGTTTNRIQYCGTTGRKNWVSGARHVLKLVDGALGNLPLNPNPNTYNGVTYHGGFTVASENPVYIQGNYNSSASDTTWTTGVDETGMAAAAVIADAVTILSNAWDDRVSMLGTTSNTSPSHLANRTATITYYRVAISAGKNRTFTWPSGWVSAGDVDPNNTTDVGTDGGIHNFLHLMENWGNTTTNYKGSLASLYYSTYNTGFYKCCLSVYNNGTRNFFFDLDFESPYGLPPGTPMFKDVESLSYRQLFIPRTN